MFQFTDNSSNYYAKQEINLIKIAPVFAAIVPAQRGHVNEVIFPTCGSTDALIPCAFASTLRTTSQLNKMIQHQGNQTNYSSFSQGRKMSRTVPIRFW